MHDSDHAEKANALAKVENKRFRRNTISWFGASASVFAEMVVVRNSLEPSRKLVSSLFFCAGEPWDHNQRIRAVQEASSRALDPFREYRLSDVFLGAAEEVARKSLHRLMNNADCWAAMPGHTRTTSLELITFKMLSRGV